MESVKKFTQAYQQTPWRKQSQLIVAFLLILVLVALVAGIYLNVSARAVTLGHEIQVMQDDMDTLQLSNEDLQTQLADLSSSAALASRAEALGFKPVDPAKIQYLQVPGYVDRQTAALAQPPQEQVVQVATVSPEFTESLIDWLKVNIFSSTGIFSQVKP